MKTLTIKQPWASLIAHGIKDIENRTWKTKYRGRIYIHAGGDKNILKKHISDDQLAICARYYDQGTLPMMDLLPLSAIIGEVDIIDCVINHHSIWADNMETYICEETGISILYPGQKLIYNWVLANPVLYDEPILDVKGKLSLWEYKP